MKKLFCLLFLAIFLINISPAYAVGEKSLNATGAGEKASDKIARIKDKAAKEIDRRLASLRKLSERINAIKRLTSVQKAGFVSGIQTEINNLTALKTKISADTDLTTLQADTQSIIQSYRIYALYIPKIHLIAACDVAFELIDIKLGGIISKLQAKITEAKTAGKDVASLETSLNGLQTKLNSAKAQIQTVQNNILNLTPEGYPGNKSTLVSARSTLQAVHKDLQSIRQDIKGIMQGLRTLNVKVTPANLKPSSAATASGNQ